MTKCIASNSEIANQERRN